MDTISQIKQLLDISDVVGSYIPLKKSGKNYKANCPFHGEDTPSFMVSTELQIFKCFGCGETGDIFTFIQKMEGVDFSKALELLADKAGVKVENKHFDPEYAKKQKIYEINQITANFYQHVLVKLKAGESARIYLKDKRKLQDTSIIKYKLGYAPNTWDILYRYLKSKHYADEDMLMAGVVVKKNSGDGFIDKFRGRIIFPLIDLDTKIVGFTGRDVVGRDPKYLNTQETLVFNKSSFLYGLEKARSAIKKGGVVFVEGQMDVVSLSQHGIQNIVASSGTSLTAQHLKTIIRYTTEVVFSFDSDSAGMTATARALSLAEQFDVNVKIVLIQQAYRDLDEYFREDPVKAKNTLADPVPVYDFYISYAIRKFGRVTAENKMDIVDFLRSTIGKIKNPIRKDQYISKLAVEIDVPKDKIHDYYSGIATDKIEIQKNITKTILKKDQKITQEDYFLSLLLKSNLDTMRYFLYKLEPQDFAGLLDNSIFESLKKYCDSNPDKFDIKYFTDGLDAQLKEFSEELYLRDLGDVAVDSGVFAKELEATFSRIKIDTVKRELKKIEAQIKLAELEKDNDQIENLLKRAKDLSEKLN